ncbi:protein of unknown function [Andreprevotia lacus DSM 23236]|jgi:hypothetical protein|uniref:DUF1841 domain-containing protein n=1 Tax=Andreprevotia lacus DSM 23236 TaxID=1121001 RepID=A0A1W1WZH5_9NEIS|nr:DUF1841 family protein [Andreprevotia lacus]SMC17044.1 protein of unknown function [Andreprevotia lacus DSM 23236]
MLFNPSRDQARRFFVGTWRKFQAGQPLEDLEKLIAGVLARHPEYHGYLSEEYLDRDWPPEHGETNPFLHISMHLAIEEQLSIDQPAGVKAAYAALCLAAGDEHTAMHEMMEGLGEMIWQAQRNGHAPDPAVYLDVLQRRLNAIRG